MLRLVTAGLRFTDVHGKPFDVTTHLLRHVSATVHRLELGVPAEVLAEIMGHTLQPDGHAPQATEYYSLMHEEQRVELHHRALLRMKELADTIVRRPIDADAEYRSLSNGASPLRRRCSSAITRITPCSSDIAAVPRARLVQAGEEPE